jgi:hypothetical protein
MRPMTLLASVLFTSLVVATVEVGCSSDDNSNQALTPFDSGTVTTPEASVGAGPVTIAVVGGGVVVSADGTPQDGGPNGFVGADGGSPIVDCPSSCTAPQGIVLYAVPTQGNVFYAWSVQGSEGGAVTSTNNSIQVSAGTGTPLTATFVPNINGLDAAVPPSSTPDAGSGGG